VYATRINSFYNAPQVIHAICFLEKVIEIAEGGEIFEEENF